MGEVNYNIDAAIFKEHKCYGIGICIRGSLGEFIKVNATWLFGLPQPYEAKANGIKKTIKWFGSVDLSKVSIELDCKKVVDNIAS